ncbi:PspC domain-containing protein [Streptomyces sp. BHT-5-2]|uniref:PspC domain-containing protein n=1 Tax=Streptomyces sp. BHT-5-2 TaxID=2866715 RepID=UPI001C8DFA9D|nr:PspC domain-containing protein [Streptomyces sp. BHT-5-2]QZL03496.1 PspC domain-containing protein [Streptomyces sp. BHT-5-2]
MNDAPTAAEPAASDPAPPPAPLRRSRRHKVVAGVCGGLGRQWDVDPVLFRVVLAVLSIGGLGLIFYGFAWLLVPLDGEEENEARRLLSGRVEGSALTALLCALAGCALFLTTLGKGSMMSFAIMVTLAVAGAAYWSRRRRRAQTEGPGSVDAATAQAVADAPPEATAPPAPNSPSWWRDPRTEPLLRRGYLWGPEDTRLEINYDFAHGVSDGPRPRGSWSPGPGPAAAPRTVAAPPRPARAAVRGIGGRTFLLAVVAGAGAGLTVTRHAALAQSLQAGLAAALVVFGLGLVLSAWLGRTGGGTVFMAVLTAALLAGAMALPTNITADWQKRTWSPTTVAAVQPHYAVGSGEGRLDLGQLAPKPGTTVRSSAEVGAGRLVVTLPQGTTAMLRLRLGVGDIQLPGDAANDVEIVAGHRERQVTLPAEGLKKGEKPRGAVELDLKVGAGQLTVERATSAPPSTATSAPAPASTPQGAPQ